MVSFCGIKLHKIIKALLTKTVVPTTNNMWRFLPISRVRQNTKKMHRILLQPKHRLLMTAKIHFWCTPPWILQLHCSSFLIHKRRVYSRASWCIAHTLQFYYHSPFASPSPQKEGIQDQLIFSQQKRLWKQTHFCRQGHKKEKAARISNS